MSAAPAPAAAAEDASSGAGKKKKLIIIGAVVAVLLAGGGGAFYMKKKAADEAAAAAAEEGGDEESDSESAAAHKAPAKSHAKDDHAAPPTFVPLDPFVVNLTDRDQDRYAQVGLSLQIDDPKLADQVKTYMPAIRNAILLLLSHKSSEDLLNPEGKERMAQEIRRDAARAMGYEVEDPFEDEEEAVAEGEPPPKKKKKKKKKSYSDNPITQVHYANFIIQ
jgi:flagellar protein FliL